jgi:hypothetical protein
MARWLVVGIGEVERPVDGGVVLAGGGACCAYATGALSELVPRLGDQVRVVLGGDVSSTPVKCDVCHTSVRRTRIASVRW